MSRPIVKYMKFKDQPFFMPMYAPEEIIEKRTHLYSGVSALNKLGDAGIWWEDWNPNKWLQWYLEFYRGKVDIHTDNMWIYYWMKYTKYLYDTVIIQDDQTLEDIPKSMKQTLLEVGCNYKQPLMHTKWTIEKLKEKL